MSPIRMSKIESSTRNALAYKEAFNNLDVDAILAMLSKDCVFEPIQDITQIKGIEAIQAYLEEMFKSNEQAKIEIEEIFGMGLHVIIRWRMNNQRGVDIFKFRGELICEKRSYAKIQKIKPARC